MDDYALVDSNIANSQLDIGTSSNLAQLCLTYSYNFPDKKYADYVCILSVLAQVSIDSAKRRFNVDIGEEIERIRRDMGVKDNGYPLFWQLIKKGFNQRSINPDLRCPMNALYDMPINKFRSRYSTLPMDYFFQKFQLEKDRRTCKKVEELINKYSLDLYGYNSAEDPNDTFLLLRSDFDKLIADIQAVYVSSSYLGLFSWLLDRAFTITPSSKRNVGTTKSVMNKNKSLLLKTLYEVNRDNLMKCFSKNLYS